MNVDKPTSPMSHPNPVSQPLASEGPETPRADVFFTVDGDSFNLSQIYRDRGYKVLPETLTIYGDLLRSHIPNFDQSYAVYLERPGQDDKLLGWNESVIVPNGTHFFTVPPASFASGTEFSADAEKVDGLLRAYERTAIDTIDLHQRRPQSDAIKELHDRREDLRRRLLSIPQLRADLAAARSLLRDAQQDSERLDWFDRIRPNVNYSWDEEAPETSEIQFVLTHRLSGREMGTDGPSCYGLRSAIDAARESSKPRASAPSAEDSTPDHS